MKPSRSQQKLDWVWKDRERCVWLTTSSSSCSCCCSFQQNLVCEQEASKSPLGRAEGLLYGDSRNHSPLMVFRSKLQVAAASPSLRLVRSFIQNPYPVPLKQASPRECGSEESSQRLLLAPTHGYSRLVEIQRPRCNLCSALPRS